MCGRLPALVSLHLCGHLLLAALKSACEILLVAWEVVRTEHIYVEHILWVWLVGSRVLVGLPCVVVCLGRQIHLWEKQLPAPLSYPKKIVVKAFFLFMVRLVVGKIW